MKKITTYKSGSRSTIEFETVCEHEPHNKSRASYILLKDYYKELDGSNYEEKYGWITWLKFRKKYFKNFLEKHKIIFCQYCGKNNLNINTVNKHNSATLDHIQPISKGGAKYDEKNIAVACHSCNDNKMNNENILPSIFEPLILSI